MRWLWGALLMGMVVTDASGIDARVAQAHRLRDQGNRAEAYALYHALLEERAVKGADAGAVLEQAVGMLQQLNRTKEADPLLEKLADLYAKDWLVLGRLARIYTTLPNHGVIVSGVFERGVHRGGGRYVSSRLRDRAQALQLYGKARALLLEQGATGVEAGAVLSGFAETLLQVEAWRLQLLTDFADLPDYEEAHMHHWGRMVPDAGRAPVDPNGNPVFFAQPASYTQAASDGERWRVLLAEVEKVDPTSRRDVLQRRADFAYQLFGEHTLQEFSWFFRKMPSEEDTLSAAYALHTLEADETIARLANGVKRFRLPPDWQFVAMYRELAADGRSASPHALDQLVRIHENRRQYPVAAEYLRTLIERYGDDRKHYRDRLEQITGNQAQFETAPVFPAGKPVVLEYRFRNGKEARFEAKCVDAPALLADLRAYLMENPREIDHNRISLHNIGHRILHQNEQKYIRETVASWTEKLEPLPDHFDRIVSIRTPLQEPGAYLVTAVMQDGSTAAQLVWIESTVIVEKPVEGRTMYFVADAVTGEPIPGATLEFFGYRIEHLSHGRNPLARRHNIETLRIAEKRMRTG
jgi:alpha-2-macroglobulin